MHAHCRLSICDICVFVHVRRRCKIWEQLKYSMTHDKNSSSSKRRRTETTTTVDTLYVAVINEDDKTVDELLKMDLCNEDLVHILLLVLETQEYVSQRTLAKLIKCAIVDDVVVSALYDYDDCLELEGGLAEAIIYNPGRTRMHSYKAHSFVVRCLEQSSSADNEAFTFHLERMLAHKTDDISRLHDA